MDDFSDIWPQWADLSRRLAYQVEQEHQVSRDALAGLDPHVAKFIVLRHLPVKARLAAEERGERFAGVYLRDLAVGVETAIAPLPATTDSL